MFKKYFLLSFILVVPLVIASCTETLATRKAKEVNQQSELIVKTDVACRKEVSDNNPKAEIIWQKAGLNEVDSYQTRLNETYFNEEELKELQLLFEGQNICDRELLGSLLEHGHIMYETNLIDVRSRQQLKLKILKKELNISQIAEAYTLIRSDFDLNTRKTYQKFNRQITRMHHEELEKNRVAYEKSLQEFKKIQESYKTTLPSSINCYSYSSVSTYCTMF
jgi:hypothetical protein